MVALRQGDDVPRPADLPGDPRAPGHHLRTVEGELAEQFGGPNKDPKVAGDRLHLNVNESIKGSRKVSATAAVSMHMFGLAVDMNYTHNPYLLSRGAPPQDVFERAGQLVKGDQLYKREKVSYKFGMYKDINAEYKMVSDANAVIVEYFSLSDPANESSSTPSSTTRPASGRVSTPPRRAS